jgi:membrane-bound ClpP family serine protease
MKTKTIGTIIMVIGLLMTQYTGFNYVTREKVVDVGGIVITADRDNTVSWGPFVGIGVIVIGGVVYLAGRKNSSG